MNVELKQNSSGKTRGKCNFSYIYGSGIYKVQAKLLKLREFAKQPVITERTSLWVTVKVYIR